MGVIGLLQLRPIPSHQTKGPGVAITFAIAIVMLRNEEDGKNGRQILRLSCEDSFRFHNV